MKIVTKSQENQRSRGKTYKKKKTSKNKQNGKNIYINNYLTQKWTKFFNQKTVYNKDLYICCLQATHFRSRDTDRLKLRGQKKFFHANGHFLKSCGSILLLDRIDFKNNTFIRDKEELYISIKGSIQEEVIKTVGVYAPNIGATQYISKC